MKTVIVRHRPRGGRDRRHHKLHEHQQSGRDARRRIAGQEGGRARADRQTLRQDRACAGLPRGDRLLGQGRADRAARKLGFQHRGLRLHDLYRQQRAASRAGGQGGHRGRSRRGGRAQRQSQFRGPRQPAGEGQLSGQPAAGRGLCPGRHDRYRSGHRAARHRQARASRSICKTSGRRQQRSAAGRVDADGASRRCSASGIDNVFDSQPDVERFAAPAKAISITGTPNSTYIQEPPFLLDLAPSRARSSRCAVRGCWRPWATRSRPTIFRPPAISRRRARPGKYLAGARRRAGGFQQLRRPPRQRPRDDPRHVRQHPHPQSSGPRHRRRRHAAPARRRR